MWCTFRMVAGVRSALDTMTCSSSVTNSFLQFVQVRHRRRSLNLPYGDLQKWDRIRNFLDDETVALLKEVAKYEKAGCLPDWANKVAASDNDNDHGPQSHDWTTDSIRVGLLARKIGMMLQWLNDGTRVLCTLLEFPHNQVVSVTDPETWYRSTVVGKRRAYGYYGTRWKITVGAVNGDPQKFTSGYRAIFDQVGIPIKARLGNFTVTEDAILPPGTCLDVKHFRVGQCISASGRTIDWGFQGVMHRWGMKGSPGTSPSKSHRRVGAIGSTGDARVWPGKRLPGHMGYEWRKISGLEVLRINPAKQVMYVKGSVPGEVGDILLIKDVQIGKKRIQNPHFPSYGLDKNCQTNANEQQKDGIVEVIECNGEIFSKKLFRFSSSSIIFTEADATKVAARDRSRAKIAKAKK